jgi:endonuclease YncB( thermonuclease family)
LNIIGKSPTCYGPLRGRVSSPALEEKSCTSRHALKAVQLTSSGGHVRSAIIPRDEMRRWTIALGLAWASNSALAGDFSGSARVIDGGTLGIAGTHIRLWGIDAPERQQTCLATNGGVYEFGRDSAAVLLELTHGRRVECEERDHDRYDRVVAICRTEIGELNSAMVRRG